MCDVRCIVPYERDRTGEKERKSDAERGRDACYETTARESPKRRGEERRARWTGFLCERAFIFYLTSSHPPCSPSPSIFLARSTFLYSSFFPSFSYSFVHSIAFLCPTASSLPCSFRLPFPAYHPSLPPVPHTNPFDFPLSSRSSPRAKIKRGATRGRE